MFSQMLLVAARPTKRASIASDNDSARGPPAKMGEAWGGFQGFFWEVLHMVFALHLTLMIFMVHR